MAKTVRAAITALGAAVPEKVVTNADFEKFLDTSDEWITQRTGIKQRHIVSDGQTTASLGAQAARQVLQQSGVKPQELELIICATISPEMIFPATACFIQQELGAAGVPAFDISAACCGYIYALATAANFIEAGQYKKVLIVGAETLSRFSDFTDRTSCILFGDGAGAALLEPTEDPNRGVQYTVLHADGAGWDFLHVPAGGAREPASHASVDQRRHYIKMKGRDVYKFAVEKMQWLLADCMEKCNLTVGDVDLVIPHQVNLRVLNSVAEKLNFPPEKVYINIDRYGNTSAASIPIAVQEAWSAGKIKRGSTLLLVAFGAGLTWAGSVVKL